MAKGYRNTLFTKVKTPNVPLNKFDLSFENLLSAGMGKLYPILCKEMLPGDRFRVKSDVLIRVMPMTSPVYGNLKAYIHYFFVPNRLVWSNWEDFITGGPNGEDTHVPPYTRISDFLADSFSREEPEVGADNVSYGQGTLIDYFNLPTYKGSTKGGQYPVKDNTPISLLPFRAFSLIWNEYYRDQNVDDEIDIQKDVDGYCKPDVSSGLFDFDYHLIRRRRWLKDYFTSALPTPQRGPDVSSPIIDTGSAIVTDGNLYLKGSGTIGQNDILVPDRGSVAESEFTIAAAPQDSTGVPSIDGTQYSKGLKLQQGSLISATINDLRQAIALQRFYEISARAGSRYIETILGHFHVKSSDARLQRPEYIGGGVTPITISEVPQTSATDETSPQGNLAGRGLGFGRTNQAIYRAEEHGYLIGILSIIPEPVYYQGINKSFSRLQRDQYYWPSFAHLGEQPIMKSELFIPFDNNVDNSAQLFGYAPRYAEYKYSPNEIHGLLRSSLSNWTFARKLDAANLNSEFLEVPAVNNPFAVQDDTDKFVIWISHNIDALRPMPFFGTPSI